MITVCGSLTEGVRARAPQARVFQVEDPPLVDGRPPRRRRPWPRCGGALGLDARPVVLYSGNFEPYQGVDLLLEAARPGARGAVRLHGRRARADRGLGAGQRGRGATASSPGKRPPRELPRFLALADVLVSPRLTA